VITAGLFVVLAAAAAVARVAMSAPLNARGTLPWGTLLVNVSGSAALGLLAGAAPEVVTVAGVGALGAYTTMSTFAVEVDVLARRAPAAAGAYVAVSLVACTATAYATLTLST
jgi:CrcB protein